MRVHESRFERVSRRSMLTGLAVAGVGLMAACSNGDASSLGSSTPSPSDDPSSPSASPSSSSASSASPSSSSGSSSGDALPSGAKLTIAFTMEASQSSGDGGRGGGPGGGGARNPYVAVWIENADSELVKTVALWHLTGGQDRWLGELSRWSATGGADTVSSATRAAGSYDLVWDGTDENGDRVDQGDYTLYIEGAREHGNYELIDMPLSLGTKDAQFQGQPSNDITAASASYSA